MKVEPISGKLAERVAALSAELGVLTVPAERLHAVAEAAFRCRHPRHTEFRPGGTQTPARIRLVTVDLAIQLEQLAFQVQHGDPVTGSNGRAPDEE